MLLDIADKRAAPALSRMLSDDTLLTRMVEVHPDRSLEGLPDLFTQIRSRINDIGGGEPRYSEWMAGTDQLQGREGLARLCELEVLIRRDRARAQDELFADLPLSAQEVTNRGNSALREAAYCRMATEMNVPYYFGSDTLARLGSANIEQFLELCGDLMARLQTQDATGRELALSPAIQDRIVREASRRYYRNLLQLPHGDLIQRFVDGVVRVAREEGKKPTIPYPPGVTGTALRMSDRARLRDEDERRMPQLEMLHRALSSAIAHNVVWIELDYRVKNSTFMVIYLNRLLCPYMNVPLGLGGFRERRLT